MILFQLRFVPSQVRRKNKDAPNLGHPNLGATSSGQRPSLSFGQGIEMGTEQIFLGRTALAPKTQIGAKAQPMYGYLRHRNTALNLALPSILALRPSPDEPPDAIELAAGCATPGNLKPRCGAFGIHQLWFRYAVRGSGCLGKLAPTGPIESCKRPGYVPWCLWRASSYR